MGAQLGCKQMVLHFCSSLRRMRSNIFVYKNNSNNRSVLFTGQGKNQLHNEMNLQGKIQTADNVSSWHLLC